MALSSIKSCVVAIYNDKYFFLFAILVFLACLPSFVWDYPNVVPLSCGLIFIISCFFLDFISKGRLFLFFYFILLYVLLGVHRGISAWPIYLSYALIPCIKDDILIKIYNYFRLVIVIVFFLSILTLILVLLEIPLSADTIEPLNTLKTYKYISYPFLVIPTHLDDEVFARFCSVFDEPGVVGTLAGMILCVEGYNFKKKGNIVIFIAGLLSVSLYFIVISTLYLFLSIKVKYKLGFIIVLLLLFIMTFETDYMKQYVWDRISIGQNGYLKGDTRNTAGLLKLYENSLDNPQILLGFGSDYVKNYTESASIQFFILKDGLIFVTLFIFGYLYLAYLYVKNKFRLLFFSLFLIGTLYQRPGFCNPEFLLLFAAYIFKDEHPNGIISINNSSKLQ